MTAKFDAFVAALEALCVEHRVQLSVSQYDALQAWDLEPGEPPVHSNGFDDPL